MSDSISADHRRYHDQELSDLKDEVKELRADIQELLEAWNTAKGMTYFVKWLSGVLIACVSLYAYITGKK